MPSRVSPFLALLTPIALSIPVALSAQEGSIAYTHSVKVEFEIPPEMRARIEASGRGRGGPGGGLPTERTDEVILFFNGSQSLMKPVPRAAPEDGRGQGRGGARGDRAGGGALTARLRGAGFGGRGTQEALVEAHTNFAEERTVEARTLLGRAFLIDAEQTRYEWKLTSEQAEFLGYAVQKATAVQDSSVVEAWFTPQIPVPGGPATFSGLPGMILVVSIDEGREQYTATAVSMSPIAEGVIVAPTQGDAVTRDEYEKIVAEKLDELQRTRRRIGG